MGSKINIKAEQEDLNFNSGGCKYPEIHVQLVGKDGNAFNILGLVSNGLRIGLHSIGMPRLMIRNEIEDFKKEAMSGNYDNLLQVCMKWVTIN